MQDLNQPPSGRRVGPAEVGRKAGLVQWVWRFGVSQHQGRGSFLIPGNGSFMISTEGDTSSSHWFAPQMAAPSQAEARDV